MIWDVLISGLVVVIATIVATTVIITVIITAAIIAATTAVIAAIIIAIVILVRKQKKRPIVPVSEMDAMILSASVTEDKCGCKQEERVSGVRYPLLYKLFHNCRICRLMIL